MIIVDIDVAKDKHDCFIMTFEGEVLAKSFTIQSAIEGFNKLYQRILSVADSLDEVKNRT